MNERNYKNIIRDTYLIMLTNKYRHIDQLEIDYIRYWEFLLKEFKQKRNV